ncbi:nucleotidyltransferase domain-containing protein [Lapidilactobacillus wuchangensis]|uniref:nucleotidyltransferase domain-containing protein n=1 Tax=Lapidilactobacillus wuchangensis TaxID=2486001 RepID=UPI000F7ABC54|nr:nucleotidyltransferase [Lapidilactobacillus wuchangensis]
MKDTSYVLQKICSQISLSDTAKANVVREYTSLGKLISNSDLIGCRTEIKPQGSYNLGTAIMPLNGSDDDFDIDLVAILDEMPTAQKTKIVIGDVLKASDLYSSKLLPEKKRAWTIDYAKSHVDVVPAVKNDVADISVTNKNSKDNYDYHPSSPFKFKEWFIEKGQDIYQGSTTVKNHIRNEVEQPEEYDQSTILQQVVQLLKFHRNKMFENRPDKEKPISMVITILAAQSYNGQNDLSTALVEVTNRLRDQIEYDVQGVPHILNPTNPKEDFTDKWKEHPERKTAFFEWLQVVERELGTTNKTNIISWQETLSKVYGEKRTRNAFNDLGKWRSDIQRRGEIPVNDAGIFEDEHSDNYVTPNTFWGD